MSEQTDLVKVFKAAWHEADERGEQGRRVEYALRRVLHLVAWELHDMPAPEDPYKRRIALAMHVLHRLDGPEGVDGTQSGA